MVDALIKKVLHKIQSDQGEWTTIIKPRTGWFDINLREIWRYRDLIKIFVYRDFVVYYKQTILGPLWFLIKPLFTTLVFTLVFSNIAKIPTDSVPPMLFYMAGTVTWTYFSTCLNSTSNTFVSNQQIFGKVYFPRMVVPISVVISQLVQFGIQFVLFLAFFAYFLLQGAPLHPNILILLLPLLVVQMAALGLGFGMIVSSMVTKYRDLTFLMEFGVQLWMYATPIVYPVSQIPVQWRFWYSLNPMVSVVELFRKSFLGAGSFSWSAYGVSLFVTLVVLALGVIIFSKVEKSFMDTV
jgi:lipopolysaccharide transport system permease protein